MGTKWGHCSLTTDWKMTGAGRYFFLLVTDVHDIKYKTRANSIRMVQFVKHCNKG